MQKSERKIEETDKLVRQTLIRLSQGYPPDLVGQAARDKLLDLRPRLQEALERFLRPSISDRLSEEEMTRQHAFKMLLEATALI